MAKDESNWEEIKGSPVWIPEMEEDELVGKIIKVIPEARFGLQCEVRKEDGKIVLTPSHKALQSQLAKIDIGDTVKIIYKGSKPNKNPGQSPTRIYQVMRKG